MSNRPTIEGPKVVEISTHKFLGTNGWSTEHSIVILADCDDHHAVCIDTKQELVDFVKQLKEAARHAKWIPPITELEKLSIKARRGNDEAAKELIHKLADGLDDIDDDEDDGDTNYREPCHTTNYP